MSLRRSSGAEPIELSSESTGHNIIIPMSSVHRNANTMSERWSTCVERLLSLTQADIDDVVSIDSSSSSSSVIPLPLTTASNCDAPPIGIPPAVWQEATEELPQQPKLKQCLRYLMWVVKNGMTFASASFWLAVAQSNKWGEKILPDNKLRIRRGMMFTSMLLTDMVVRELYRRCSKKVRWTAIQDMPNWMFFPTTNNKIIKLLEYATTPACNKTIMKQTVHRHLKVLFPSVCTSEHDSVNYPRVANYRHDVHNGNMHHDNARIGETHITTSASQRKRKHTDTEMTSQPSYIDALPSTAAFTDIHSSSDIQRPDNDDDDRIDVHASVPPITITSTSPTTDITTTPGLSPIESSLTYEDFEHRLVTLHLNALELIRKANDGNDIVDLRDKIISATRHHLNLIISDISSIHPHQHATDNNNINHHQHHSSSLPSQTSALTATQTQDQSQIIESPTESSHSSLDHGTFVLDTSLLNSALDIVASSAGSDNDDVSATAMQSIDLNIIIMEQASLLQKKRRERGKVIQKRLLRQYQTKLNRFIKKHHTDFKQAEPEIPETERLGDMLLRREYKPRRSVPSRSVPLIDGMSLPYYGKRRRLNNSLLPVLVWSTIPQPTKIDEVIS